MEVQKVLEFVQQVLANAQFYETAVIYMMEFLAPMYIWLKALHLVSVIAWMAGILYLPRLFVYHCSATPGTELSETLKIMERRLLRAILNPAMVVTWVFGLGMLFVGGEELFYQSWMIFKLICALIMTIIHMMLAKWRRVFEADLNTRTPRFYRIVNEVPTVLLIVIVVMAIVKPA